ncbi:MAG TPA: hypothetical protein ENJ59_02290 [Thermofilum sp.]|nr:hypothetical protein [Thermofilum sp.]
MTRKSLEIAAASICGVLYAIIGYASYLGIFAPVVGVVRFWPSVFVPAVFSVVFGPWVGGAGAAIGIFISDMTIHGNALLSLSVGVPANFVGFYVVGLLSEKRGRKWGVVAVLEQLGAILITIICWRMKWLSWEVAAIFLAGMFIAVIITSIFSIKENAAGIVFASSTGLLIGSAIIGMGVYTYSQFFTLPSGESNLSAIAALLWFLWTYVTEVPFIVSLTPPIVAVAEKVVKH